MSSPEKPVFGGLLPSQIAALAAPICESACTVHKARKWVYVSGVHVDSHLNKIFGFDGWDLEIRRLDTEPPTKSSDGKWQAIATAHVRLTIRTPGGRTFFRDGVASAEQTSSNVIDVVDNAAGSAVTYALRNAAIRCGNQFGLAVMRLKVEGIDWKRYTAKTPPVWPDFVQAGTGEAGQKVAEVELPSGDAYDNAGSSSDAPLDYKRESAPAEERKAPPAEEKKAPPAEERKSAPAEEKKADPPPAEKKADPGPHAYAADLTSTDQGAKRNAYVESCRANWTILGNDAAKPVFAAVCEETGKKDLLPHLLRRTEADGGPSVEFLVMLRSKLKAAATAAGKEAAP